MTKIIENINHTEETFFKRRYQCDTKIIYCMFGGTQTVQSM